MPFNFDDYLDRLAEKDDEAFAAVYENTKRGVYSMIVAIVRDRHATEDLMQDTYIKMLKNIHSYQRGRNFTAWLFEIAKNLAYDHLRQNRAVRPADPQEESYLFDQAQPPAGNTDFTLEEMMSPLDPEERQVVLLRTVSETKFKDIAVLMDRPLGTVLWIYNKALAKMRKNLGKE